MKDSSIIKLKNVSKFYYSKGVIASGFSKINLEFKIGEFVAITGESGSGKSTLLNVISGLDSYEEGEMYIDGFETSHYTEKEFEDYRRKYIGNIFQNFNLVNSYTVYQNIELVLLLNGCSKRKIKKNIIELIKKVGLYKFRNTKVSKLSGGQKQRVAIARALAKDTPMIIADEPTGNLDSKSAKEIIKLLSEIAKDKLVIIVTHNYEQVEPYVTRKIKMHDGKILEDKKLKPIESDFDKNAVSYKNITLFNRLRLGFRNTFNIIPKFILVLLVYLFLSVSIISVYASMKEEEFNQSNSGYNYVFTRQEPERIVIKKKDNLAFTEEDYEKIMKLDNIDRIIENDLLLDKMISVSDNENLWFYGTIENVKNFSGDLTYGRMPENEDEIILYSDDYYATEKPDIVLNKQVTIVDYFDGKIINNKKYTIVGIKEYINDSSIIYSDSTIFYVDDSVIESLGFSVNQYYSKMYVTFLERRYKIDTYAQEYKIEANENVPIGKAYISEDYKYLCKDENCYNQPVGIDVYNKNFEEHLTVNINGYYNKKNYKDVLKETREFEEITGIIFINKDDYNKLFNKGTFQSSVYVKDNTYAQDVGKKLKENGYEALVIKETYVTEEFSKIFRLIETITLIIVIISVFFICYFVLNIILKSRNTYFAIIRMLGANSRISKQLLTIELLVASTLSYIIVILTAYLFKNSNSNIAFINSINKYLNIKDYILLFIIIFLMSYVISKKYARKLFKNSAMNTIREEVL